MVFFTKLWRGLTQNVARLDRDHVDVRLWPVETGISGDQIRPAIERFVSANRGWAIVSWMDEREVHLTRTTSVMRFVDDVHVRWGDTAVGIEIHATSQSRLGKGDLGQNTRNLIKLTTGLQKQFPTITKTT